MCVVMAKYFDDYGWVAAKNRDRNYTPDIEFVRATGENGVERLLFKDKVTEYSEGINSRGVGIVGASLMVIDDEKEISKNTNKHSPDGKRISRALRETNARDAALACAEYKLTGSNIVIDAEHCFLVEACLDKDGKYRYKIQEISKDQTVCRTNHGIWLPWAGYQRDPKDKNQTLSRISSEARLAQGEIIVDTAKDPEDMIDGMCKVIVDNPQLNVMRTDTATKKMRTTAQLMAIPTERTLYCRPVSSHITFDFWKLNKPEADTWVELLSNRALYKDVKDGDPPFDGLTTLHTTDGPAKGSR